MIKIKSVCSSISTMAHFMERLWFFACICGWQGT